MMRWFAFLFLMTAALTVSARTSAIDSADAIEAKAEKLLLANDLTKLAAELASTNSATIEDLLVKLSVFGRAGHRGRVHSTLRALAKNLSAQDHSSAIVGVVRKSIEPDDLDGLRLFYENFAQGGDDRCGHFVWLWLNSGDAAELEKWLKERAGSETWWPYFADVKKLRGTGAEVAKELESAIRRNPDDFRLVQRYLNFVNSGLERIGLENTPIKPSFVRLSTDVFWLTDVVANDAFGAYKLGVLFQNIRPETSIDLLRKSLSLEFTAKAAKSFAQDTIISPVSAPRNPEKELRYLTKSKLVGLYLQTKLPELAQPIVEELTSGDFSDIQADRPFNRAGMVQASTGMRVIESRILQNEATDENSSVYWLDRIAYYRGRNEQAAVWQSIAQALAKVRYVPGDSNARHNRILVLNELRSFDDDDESAVEILRNEIIRARDTGDYEYVYFLSEIICGDFESLVEEFFVNNDLLPKSLAALADWTVGEQSVISIVMESEKWDAQKRDEIWDLIARCALEDVRRRAYRTAETMIEAGQYELALRLLTEKLKALPDDGYIAFLDRRDAQRLMFKVYLGIGDWRKGEQLWRDGFRVEDALGQLALVAAEKGEVADAFRLWRLNANLDRRNLTSLPKLSKTKAAPAIRGFYIQMKTADPLTNVPTAALAMMD